jgi:hypothetical protein
MMVIVGVTVTLPKVAFIQDQIFSSSLRFNLYPTCQHSSTGPEPHPGPLRSTNMSVGLPCHSVESQFGVGWLCFEDFSSTPHRVVDKPSISFNKHNHHIWGGHYKGVDFPWTVRQGSGRLDVRLIVLQRHHYTILYPWNWFMGTLTGHDSFWPISWLSEIFVTFNQDNLWDISFWYTDGCVVWIHDDQCDCNVAFFFSCFSCFRDPVASKGRES